MNNNLHSTLITAAFSLAAASQLSATISIIPGGSGTFIEASPVTYDYTALSSFDASAASKLVVTVSDELGSGDDAITGITFGGVSLNPIVSATNPGGFQNVYMYYLDASSVSGGVFGTGDLVITGPNGSGEDNDFGGSYFFLNGTADGFAATAVDDNATSVSLTTTAANSWVIAAYADNSGNATADAPMTQVLGGLDVGSAGGASGYQEIATIGTNNFSFSHVGGLSRPVTIAAEFTAIPEPSTALLGALGGLCLLHRRRR